MEKKEIELPGHVMVSTRRAAKVEAEIQRLRGHFITERLDQKRRELGVKEFDKQRDKLAKAFEEAWEQMREAKATLRSFEDRMTREIMNWPPLERAYRTFFEAKGEPKTVIEKTIASRRRTFKRKQRIVKERLRPKLDPVEDMRRRMLNPETRRDAIKEYLINHVYRADFQMETFELILEELDKCRRR